MSQKDLLASLETSATLPSPPFIPLKGIPNFRQVGGYPIPSAGSPAGDSTSSSTNTAAATVTESATPAKSLQFRRNYLFRCGLPEGATPETVAKIKELGITHVFDFRSRVEVEGYQAEGKLPTVITTEGGAQEGADEGGKESKSGSDGWWPGVERVYCPVFPEDSFDPVSLATRYADYGSESEEGFVNAYRAILTQAPTAYARVLHHIASHPTTGLIIHCTAGKDRTGVLAALLLSLCGVDDDTIADEYALTELGVGKWMDYLVMTIMKQVNCDAASARRMAGAQKGSMLRTLKMLKEEFGGAREYFVKTCGVEEGFVDKVREVLVEERVD